MANPFLGEIRLFAFNFAPVGWAPCAGQFLPISQNTALFALLGTFYGGDGVRTFALPNLQGRVPVHWGTAGSFTYQVGQAGGDAEVVLTTAQMPVHRHSARAYAGAGTTNSPSGTVLAQTGAPSYALPPATTASLVDMDHDAIAHEGGSQAVSVLQPFLTLNFCIALAGIFPARS